MNEQDEAQRYLSSWQTSSKHELPINVVATIKKCYITTKPSQTSSTLIQTCNSSIKSQACNPIHPHA